MDRFESVTRPLMWFMALLLVASVTGCGGGSGGGSPILGGGGGAGIAPTVTAVAPLNNATGVPTNNTIITAEFSEPMAPITGTASFTVTCTACASPTGTVTLDATGRIATFTTAASLTASTLYTATVTGAKSLATGLALASPYVWHFTTGVAPDTTKPRVTLTVPATTTPGPTPNVPTNTAITAAFTEDMAPATINGTSFTLTGPGVTPVAGTVTYAVGTAIATFTPAAPLLAATTYTATIKGTGATPATDLAGNALAGNPATPSTASDYVWTFTTAAAAPAGNITVLSTNPAAGATTSCSGAGSSVSATFTVPSGLRMDPLTVTSGTFTVTGPGLTVVTAASVTLDVATGTIATFTPLAPLQSGVLYTATIKGGPTGVKDLAVPTANTMAADKIWTFTPSAAVCLAPISLGSAAPFGNLGGTAGTTNQGINTVINGDIASTATVTSAITGFHDTAGDIYTETPLNIGTVNGLIYTCTVSTLGPTSGAVIPASCAIATQAKADAQAAYNTLAGLPPGGDPGAGQLGGLTLAPGVYTAAGGSFLITGTDLTLDAQGNANAVWVFQMASTLTVGAAGAPRSVILTNGAQAKNVFWQVGTSATINAAGGGTMVGNIIASSAVSFSTAGNATITTLNGRATGLNASVTMTNTVINVPAP
ncbi:MAG: ice-binding family protein [Burkholderiales bacterium]